MYESFFKTIELSMQPAIGMAEINRLAMERIASQQTECLSGCIKTGMEQWCACTDFDDPKSLADMQFKYLKLYEQQLSMTAEANMQTLNQASEALQKVMGASLDHFSGNNPFMALMADLGVSSSAGPFFDWFKESVATSQSVAETVAQSAASPAAVKPLTPANSPAAKPKAANRASAPSKSTTQSTASSGNSSTNTFSKSASSKSASSKSTSSKSALSKNTSSTSTSNKGSDSKSTATSRSGAQTSTGKTPAGDSVASGKVAASPATSAQSSTPQRVAEPAKNSSRDNTGN